jgi:site-specific recombinase XerD
MPAYSSTSITKLLEGYCLAARAEARSPKTIQLVTGAVKRFAGWLSAGGRDGREPDVMEIGPAEIRGFIVHLQEAPCFSRHPYIAPRAKGLSGHTISCYLRSLRSFWSWLAAEEIIPENPFRRVRLPRPPTKIIAIFSPDQFQSLVAAIDGSTPDGYRNIAVLTVLLDTGLRVSELANLTLENTHLEEGCLKVIGKGRKERLVPIGKRSRNLLWNYVTRFRPEPAHPNCTSVFLNSRGMPLGKNYIEAFMRRYGKRAGIEGVRCSPHTLRHSAAVMFLRNGGDVFTLQRLLGHTTLQMTRHYCELADIDVTVAHRLASPADNLPFAGPPGRRPRIINLRAGRRSVKYMAADSREKTVLDNDGT